MKCYLALIFHLHQPVGNYSSVFEEAYQKSYLPLVNLIREYPHIFVTLHISGSLWDWLYDHHPDFLAMLKEPVQSGQVELLSGGYYEPILSMISEEDQHEQVHRLNQTLQDYFHVQPAGLWLAERVWAPHLVRVLDKNSLQYTILDDDHFYQAGVWSDYQAGYHMTEFDGYKISVFANSKQMRYQFPNSSVDNILQSIKNLAKRNPRSNPPLIVIADDAEKFGMWGDSYEHCWTNGYMESFFTNLSDNQPWLETITPRNFLDQFPSRGLVYIPSTSYSDMVVSTLLPEDHFELEKSSETLNHRLKDTSLNEEEKQLYRVLLKHLRGSFWPNFLVKYPEANHMHKRTQHMSKRIRKYLSGSVYDRALSHVLAAQCNCGYWHSLFGGIYLAHIRRANYENLLTAESCIPKETIDIEQIDFNYDGYPEIIVNTEATTCIISPAMGGSISEWSSLTHLYNFTDIVNRRKEGYLLDRQDRHHVDNYQHRFGIEHVLPSATRIEEILSTNASLLIEAGKRPYKTDTWNVNDQTRDVQFHMTGLAEYTPEEDVSASLFIEKTIQLKTDKNYISLDYKLTNTTDAAVQLLFVIETVFNFGEKNLVDIKFAHQDTVQTLEILTIQGIDQYQLISHDNLPRIGVKISQPANVCQMPLIQNLETDQGDEVTINGYVFFNCFQLSFSAQQTQQLGIIHQIDPTD